MSEAGDPSGPAPASARTSTADTAPDLRPWSLWSIASMVCATLLVPPFCLLAPVLGLAGLSEVKYKKRRGGRLAAGGILLGFLATVAWSVIALQLATSTRPLLLGGPVKTLNAGVDGNLPAFREGLWGGAAEVSDAELQTFVDQLRRRHGRVVSSQQAADQGTSSAEPVEDGQVRIRYEMKFDRGAALVDAVFVQHAPGKPLPWVLRWRSIEVVNPGGANLRLPAAAPAEDPAPERPATGDDAGASSGSPGP
jgi:hypothetical protein